MRGRDSDVLQRAREYLDGEHHFTFSIITRYEILRGLKARQADKQIAAFEQRCRESEILPITDDVVVRAADIYAHLHRSGRLVTDADILIAATALTGGLTLVTNNTDHFSRVPGLSCDSWRRTAER